MNETVDGMLDFLDLSRHKLIEKFISTHTQGNAEEPKNTSKNRLLFSTKRNSKDMAFEWRKHIKNTDLSNIQKFCSKSMKMLGYNIINDTFDDRYPILDVPPLKLIQ